MSSSSTNGVVIVAMGLILILLLVVGGVGFYYVAERQQMAVAVATERAHVAEARAMIERAEAERALDLRTRSKDKERPAVDADAIRDAVSAVLRAQEMAWNRGDIDAFMEHYWKSDELTFSAGGQTTRGWQATLERYRERYSMQESMGRLRLSDLKIAPMGDSAALVLGQWKVDRESEPVSGNFSLILRKLDDRWLIVHDHTSRLTE